MTLPKFSDSQRVLITRRPDPMPEGWGDFWTPELDKYIGEVAEVVTHRCGHRGYVLDHPDFPVFLTFPAEALELA